MRTLLGALPRGRLSGVHTFVLLLASPVGHPCEVGPFPTQDGAGGWALKPITHAPALKLALHPTLGG